MKKSTFWGLVFLLIMLATGLAHAQNAEKYVQKNGTDDVPYTEYRPNGLKVIPVDKDLVKYKKFYSQYSWDIDLEKTHIIDGGEIYSLREYVIEIIQFVSEGKVKKEMLEDIDTFSLIKYLYIINIPEEAKAPILNDSEILLATIEVISEYTVVVAVVYAVTKI